MTACTKRPYHDAMSSTRERQVMTACEKRPYHDAMSSTRER
jgi:hypothetical protein